MLTGTLTLPPSFNHYCDGPENPTPTSLQSHPLGRRTIGLRNQTILPQARLACHPVVHKERWYITWNGNKGYHQSGIIRRLLLHNTLVLRPQINVNRFCLINCVISKVEEPDTRKSLQTTKEGPSKSLRQREHVRHQSPYRNLWKRHRQLNQYSIPSCVTRCSSSGCHTVGAYRKSDTREAAILQKSHPTNDCSRHGPGPLHAAHRNSAWDCQNILLRPWLGLLGLLPTDYHTPTPAPHKEREQFNPTSGHQKIHQGNICKRSAGLDHLQSVQPSHAIPHLHSLAVVRALALFV